MKWLIAGVLALLVWFYDWFTTPCQRLYMNPPYGKGTYKCPRNDRKYLERCPSSQ